MVKDLIDIVERVLFVDDSVEQDAKGPDILLLAAVRFSLQDFWRSVVWERGQSRLITNELKGVVCKTYLLCPQRRQTDRS